MRGHLNVAKELINTGAFVNLKHKHRTQLIYEFYSELLKVGEYLIKAGAYVNLEGGRKTPHTAACLRAVYEQLICK